jgi:GNAT superfamily N-acetyltransferase
MTREDEPAVLDLMRESLGEGSVPRTAEFWQWKHERNPFGTSPVLVAEADGRLVGLRAFMRWAWASGTQTYSTVRAVDTATHPDYRGRGIFKRLTLQLRDEMAEEGAAFVFNTPNGQSRPGYLKMGWSYVGRPTLWVRPVRPLRLLRARLGEGVGGEEGPPPPVGAPRAVEVLEQWGDGVPSQAPAGGARLHTSCTGDYLTWRYAEVPGLAYYALSEGDGASRACLFVRARQRGALRELRVCDVVVGPTRAARRSLRRLLRAAPDVAEVDVVIGMASGSATLRLAFLASGYLPAPRTGPILTTHPLELAPGAPDPCHLSAWGASIGALELF